MEPLVPIPPDPDPNPYWNPNPALCPSCRTLLQNVRPERSPSSHGSGFDEGWCPVHGVVTALYRNRPR